MWSNRSPATGSNRLPRRRSRSIPLSSALSAASWSARSEMSVPTTREAWRAACSAWMPHPVPRSSTERAAVGIMSPLSVVDAPPTPSTCSSGDRAAERQLAQVRRDPPGDHARGIQCAVRAHVESRAHGVALGSVDAAHDEAERLGAIGGEGRQRGIQCGGVHRDAEHEDARRGWPATSPQRSRGSGHGSRELGGRGEGRPRHPRPTAGRGRRP